MAASMRNRKKSNPDWTILPGPALSIIFTYLDLTDLRNCLLTCRSFNWYLEDENSEVWRYHCHRIIPNPAFKSVDLLHSIPTFKAKLRAYYYAWSSSDKSKNVYILEDGFTLHRSPVAQSSDGARSKMGFRTGRHCWEVWWDSPKTSLGTVALIGIATKAAQMHARGYVALIGRDAQSWGWNIVDNHLLHDGVNYGEYPLLNNAEKYRIGERLRVILDCDDNTLSFEKNYEFLGVAFRGLPKVKLYPTVSAVYGNTEITMVYLGKPLDGSVAK